jgi:hypothetical protein
MDKKIVKQYMTLFSIKLAAFTLLPFAHNHHLCRYNNRFPARFSIRGSGKSSEVNNQDNSCEEIKMMNNLGNFKNQSLTS